MDDSIGNTSYTHQCYICEKIFSANSNLNRHLRNIHQESVQSPYNNVKCALCDEVFSSSSYYNTHLTKDHQVSIDTDNLKFASFSQFVEWKTSVERQTVSQFIKSRGVKRTEDLQKIYYSCNRSGYYVSKARTHKALKKQGSRKINGRCPASMNVTINEDSSVEVKYVRTHVGHDFELKHLDLSERDRDLIVQKLEQGVPKKDIIKQIRSSVDGNAGDSSSGTIQPAPSRIHLTTTKDIHNIINSKHLDSKLIRHNYDLINVEAWITETKEFNEKGSVLLYKPQAELCHNFPQLRGDDFILVIMKQGQAEILKQCGHVCIIIDSTHNVHCEYLHLACVSVVDEEGKAFPVAFLYSTRTDEQILEVFFTVIRDKVGKIATRMVIADELDDFYSAWTKVMARPTHNLLTPWCVSDNWAKKFDLVNNKDKLRKLKKQLRILLTEHQRDKFNSTIKTMLIEYRKDPDVREFLIWLEQKYLSNTDVWSNCLRKEHGASNAQLWKQHEKFRNIYREGKNSKKLCKSIEGLMQLFEDNQFDRLVALEEVCPAKLNAVADRHRKSIETAALVYEIAVDPVYWLVPSDSTSDVYYEVHQLKGTDDCSCNLKCLPCNTCIHCFRCNCLDYTINLNMCKHIHRVCSPSEGSAPSSMSTIAINLPHPFNGSATSVVGATQVIDAGTDGSGQVSSSHVTSTQTGVVARVPPENEIIVHELQAQNESLAEQLNQQRLHTQELESAFELTQQQNQQLMARIQELERRASGEPSAQLATKSSSTEQQSKAELNSSNG